MNAARGTRRKSARPHPIDLQSRSVLAGEAAAAVAEVDRVARGFDTLGLVAGYRVLLALGNRTEFVTSYLGALRARLVAVPVNPRSATIRTSSPVAERGLTGTATSRARSAAR